MPTTAAGVVLDPTVIKINPKPIWKTPAKKLKIDHDLKLIIL